MSPLELTWYSSGDNLPYFTGQITVDHSYEHLFSPTPFMLASNVRSHQTAGGYLVHGSTENGTNENQFFYNDAKSNTYWGTVNAAYNNIAYDKEGGNLTRGHIRLWDVPNADAQSLEDYGDNSGLPGGRHGKRVTILRFVSRVVIL